MCSNALTQSIKVKLLQELYKMRMIEKVRKLYYEYLKIPFIRKILLRNLKIKNSTDSIEYIIKSQCSVSRYGDGELDVIWGGSRGFQKANSALAQRLKDILCSHLPNHIVCLPYPFLYSSNLRESSNKFWAYYVGMNIKKLLKVIDLRKQYYDTEITRFYIDYKDRSGSAEHLRLLKKIWENKNIIIVEGTYTASGVGNDLFNGASSIKRIICPAENAFDKYDSILKCVKENSTANDLILISLGMTATVLAYDLAKEGLQAIDLGHLDVEYEWFLLQADWKTYLPNKYVNEVEDGNKVKRCTDAKYLTQIITEIK